MAEYTYKGIIIDPNSEEAKNAIGKEVYFEAKPFLCLKAANEKLASNLGILVEVYKDSINPFCVKGKSGSYKYPCIIEKKEEPKPVYTSFKNAEEFLDAYYHNETENLDGVYHYLATRGIWLKDKSTEVPVYCMVTEVWDNGVIISDKKMSTTGILIFNDTTSWSELYESFTFLDGTPCGRLEESK